MRATVQAVVPLTSFAGQVRPVDVAPRFAMTVHVESVVPAVSNFPEGGIVTLAIHSPTLLLAGEPATGKTYNFSVHHTSQGENTKFFGLTVDSVPPKLEQFIGTWEIRKSPTIGKANLAVTIVQAGDTINGSIKFINPDGTTTQWPLARPEFKGITVTPSLVSHSQFKGATLHFQTVDHDSIMYWSLTLTNARSGVLRGDEHELLIEEKVKKKR